MCGKGHPGERRASDGFLAPAALQARFDANAAASLLQCVTEALNPTPLKNHQGILKGITEWEVRVDSLDLSIDQNCYFGGHASQRVSGRVLPTSNRDSRSHRF